jgi:hypothetical protein
LPPRQLRAFVIVEPLLQRRPAIGGHAAKALLVAADRRDLCDCGLDSPIGGRQDDRVTAGIAGTPDPDPVGVDVLKVSRNEIARRQSAICC